MVANLPYNITKMALRQMLPLTDRISHLHFMLQVCCCQLLLPAVRQAYTEHSRHIEYALLTVCWSFSSTEMETAELAALCRLGHGVHTGAEQLIFSSRLHWLQDEVAQRLTAATPGDYRAMNIEVAFFSRPRYLFKVDRSAYFPVPKCDGAMVDFELRPAAARPQLPMTDAQFLGVVRPRTTHTYIT